MFRRLDQSARAAVRIVFEGQNVEAREGDTVAGALLAAGHVNARTTPATGASRGPYCMMGVCFDCLMVIDGVSNRQACQAIVAEGMRVERQQGARAKPVGDEA